ncbi:MAG: ribonuclease Z [Candidatus Bathyarchaeia archaeon]
MIEIVFLGTGGSMPSRARSLPSIVIRREGEVIMFDCGEGTQMQMTRAKIGFNKEMAVFITHMHGDHVLGLPGMIQSMALLGRDKPLEIYGPPGISGYLEAIDTYVPYTAGFELKAREVTPGLVINEAAYRIRAVWVNHSTPCLAYAFIEKPRPGKFNPKYASKLKIPEGPLWKRLQMGRRVTVNGKVINPREVVGPPRPGKKIVYSGDTKPCSSIIKLSEGADVLIHDSTFGLSRGDKAGEYGHSTSTQAAEIARRARVKRLFLTHVSAIYDDEGAEELLKEARRVFRHTFLAYDLMRVEV